MNENALDTRDRQARSESFYHQFSKENNAHSEPMRETHHILVLSRSYIHKTITVNFQGEPKKMFKDETFSVR